VQCIAVNTMFLFVIKKGGNRNFYLAKTVFISSPFFFTEEYDLGCKIIVIIITVYFML
jgi:hypothetical protein